LPRSGQGNILMVCTVRKSVANGEKRSVFRVKLRFGFGLTAKYWTPCRTTIALDTSRASRRHVSSVDFLPTISNRLVSPVGKLYASECFGSAPNRLLSRIQASTTRALSGPDKARLQPEDSRESRAASRKTATPGRETDPCIPRSQRLVLPPERGPRLGGVSCAP
jgi:hypothetical protein